MRVHTAWRKNQRREVRHTLGRYLAILMIVALGVGFFAGLKVTQRAMVDTGDAYVQKNALYDEELLSTIGVTDEEAEQLAEMDGVASAEGSVSEDFLAEMGDGVSYVLAAHSITDTVNLLTLKAGRMPEAADECVLDARSFGESDIGRTITVSQENDEDTIEAFAYSQYTVVGTVNSVCYLNLERGTTRLAGGKVSAFVYLPKDGFQLDYDTEIYVRIDNDGGRIFSDAYNDAADAMEQPLTDELERLSKERYHSLVQDALDEISDAERKYDDGLADYEQQKADADQELADAWAKLENAKEQIDDGWGAVCRNEDSLKSAQSEYETGEAAYEQALGDFTSQKSAAEAQFGAAQQAIDTQRAQAEAQLAAIEGLGCTEQEAALREQLAVLDAAQQQLDAQREASELQFDAAQAELDQTKANLDAAAQQIEDGQTQLSSAKHALYVAKSRYDEGVNDYNDSKADADRKLADAKKELDDAKTKIDDAKADLADIKEPDDYVFGRADNIGYSCFENDSSIVDGIAKVFPVFFFLVAALVCMTTMARMVEEQRTQIGTLKALGYGDGAIAWKYISYSASAATIGSVAGFFGGIKLFPWVIWQAYGMLYGFAPILYVIDWTLFAVSLAVSLLCSAGVTYITCRAEMTLMPAELMRPKTPKEGKRVLLERIPFLWNRLNFLKKISLRNVFRYKKRLFMMVLGIGGCTALLITGLGIRDSISNIVSDQFDNIMKYDFAIVFDEAETSSGREQFQSDTQDLLGTCVFVCADTLEVPTSGGTRTANVIATGDEAITSLLDLHKDGETVPYPADGSVVISDKLAKDAGVSAGDTITVRVGEKTEELPVGGVFENYVYHYMLMTPATYKTVFGEECAYKTALATSAEDDVHAVSARLISDFGAANVTVTADIRTRVANMMTSLDYIVVLVIACAAALAFVVLFNLSNINITERVREIATIKVLGFYAPEVGAYVFRENFVLTVLGAAAGVPLGIWLHGFVMGQIDFDMVNFQVVIAPLSYLIAIATTFVFTFTVDLLMRRKLGKIDMVESLKAIE